MSNLPTIDYTARDFETIMEALKVNLKNRYPNDWTDFYNNSLGYSWLEVIAYTSTILNYYLDAMVNEAFLPVAQDRQSVIYQGALVGYKLSPPTSASVVCELTIAAAQIRDVIISKGSQLTADNGLIFEFAEEAVISAGLLEGTGVLVHGETQIDNFTSDGTAFQTFVLTNSGVADGTIVVTINGVVWTLTDSLVYGDSGSEVYEVSYDINDVATIKTGNGTSGKIPASAATITVSYRVGGGIKGNINIGQLDGNVQGRLGGIEPPSYLTVDVYNAERGSGGLDRETIDHAKYWIPRYVQTNGRAVTKKDFETLSALFSDPIYGAPAYASAKLRQEVPELNCLTGDTKVSLLDGTEVCIKDLVGKEEFWVYSCTDDGKIVPGRGHSVRVTKVVAELVEIVLDNGEIVRCTPEHPFMLRDGSYVKAECLVEGQSLMPLYRMLTDDCNGKGSYEFVKNPSGSFEPTHLVVCGRKRYLDDGLVVHHKNFNKRDNSPDNLIRITSQEHRKLHTDTSRKVMIDNWKNPEFVEKMRSVHSAIMKKLWSEESFREKMLLVSKDPDRAKKIGNTIRNSPELMAMHKELGTSTLNKLWKDENFREKKSKNSSITMSVTRRRIVKENKFAKVREYLRKVSSETLKSTWLNPGFRENQEKLRGERNSNPDFQLKCVSGKYINMVRAVLKECGGISEESWEKVRCSFVSNGMYAYPKFRTAIDKYGSVENLSEVALNNHKVSKISRITVDPTPVYDLTVDDYHNFALSAGVFVHNCVDIYLWSLDSEGNPVAPGSGLIGALQSYFDNNDAGAVRLISVDTVVQAGTNLYVDIEVSIKVADGFAIADVLSSAQDSIESLFSSSDILPGEDIRISLLYKSIQATAGVTYATVDVLRASIIVENESVGVAGLTNYTYTTIRTPVAQGSVTINSGSLVVTDDGLGNLIGNVSSAGNNTIDYDTGAIDVTFSEVTTAAVTVTYRKVEQVQRGEEESISTGKSRIKSNLHHSPVVPGTFNITDGSQNVRDDGDGNLIGDVDPSGSNTIVYESGSYDFTLLLPPGIGNPISSTYRQYLDTPKEDTYVEDNYLPVVGVITVRSL